MSSARFPKIDVARQGSDEPFGTLYSCLFGCGARGKAGNQRLRERSAFRKSGWVMVAGADDRCRGWLRRTIQRFAKEWLQAPSKTAFTRSSISWGRNGFWIVRAPPNFAATASMVRLVGWPDMAMMRAAG